MENITDGYLEVSMPLSKPKYGKTIAARLKESEMASLKQLMANYDLPNLTALLRGLLNGTLGVEPVNNSFGFVNNQGDESSRGLNTPLRESVRGPVVQRYERPPRTRENPSGSQGRGFNSPPVHFCRFATGSRLWRSKDKHVEDVDRIPLCAGRGTVETAR